MFKWSSQQIVLFTTAKLCSGITSAFVLQSMQYHPSMHVEGSRSDPLDMSLGASSVTSGQPHTVAMPASFIPAAVPPVYRDYASVDPINAQVSFRVCAIDCGRLLSKIVVLLYYCLPFYVPSNFVELLCALLQETSLQLRIKRF